MLNYFLQEEEPCTSQKTKKIAKETIIKQKRYEPFHLDCQYSKRKVCYCHINPACNLSNQQKVRLWRNYEKAADFYKGITVQEKQDAKQKYDKCVQKVRHLDKFEILAYVNKLQAARISNSANDSYPNLNEGYFP